MKSLNPKISDHDLSFYLAHHLSQHNDFVFFDSSDLTGKSFIGVQAERELAFSLKDKTDFQTFAADLRLHSPHGNENSGWVILLSYEALALLQDIPDHLVQRLKIDPHSILAYARYYPQLISVDNQTQTAQFLEKKFTFSNIPTELENLFIPHSISSFSIGKECKSISQKSYLSALEKIKNDILNGRFYEINFSIPNKFEFSGDVWSFYKILREKAEASMMAYFNHKDFKIASASPECFFKIERGKMCSFPIKGTIKRGVDHNEDELLIEKLQNSTKEAAELLMITDLIRNDMGKICEYGSIDTLHLKKLLSLKNYHHLYSEIQGSLKKSVHFLDLLEAIYPGGSITGAPKAEAIQAIFEYENRHRGFYTGSLGFILDNGFSEFNILIRTAIFKDSHFEFSTGSGIVNDSDPYSEYMECELKKNALMKVISDE